MRFHGIVHTLHAAIHTALFAFALLAVCGVATASAVTTMPRSVIAAGGFGGTSNHNTIRSTVGQAVVLNVSSAHHAIRSGFWWPGQVPSDLMDQGAPPSDYALRSVFPNPFSGTMEIRYDIPASGGDVSLRIYDVAGRLVRNLVHGVPAAGTYRTVWNGTDDSGRRAGPGLYLLSFVAPGRESTRKIVLLP